MLLAHPRVREFDYSSLVSFVYGSAPMSVEKLREAMEIFGPVFVQGYGQSEALMMCTYLSAREHVEALSDPGLIHRLASVGREGPLVRLGIMDDNGAILPAGRRGEIVVRSDIVMDTSTIRKPPHRRTRSVGITRETLATKTRMASSTSWTARRT
jgi:acyl-CoA synthetase (AMP-forming)/AMP-acid ligase II